MKYFLFIIIAILTTQSFSSEPSREKLRCLTKTNEFFPFSSVSLYRSNEGMSVVHTKNIPVEITRAFKEFGFLTKFEELAFFDTYWLGQCKSTSLEGWFECDGEMRNDTLAFKARSQDKNGVIHERGGVYPKGFRVKLVGNMHHWSWAFEFGGKKFEYYSEFVSCQYRDYSEEGK